ncbi:hypothetical protein [Lacticaseibacillus paracasei]|uniref:hypothetical protein n=1 Tax=Lacticaseibacillus paracasei TaxID=1597 RepID=UPI004045A5B7
MNEIINQIQAYDHSKFKNVSLMEQIIKKYNSLDSDTQKQVEPYMYVVYRGKFDSLFTSANYIQAISWGNKVVCHERFKQERSDNKDHFFIEDVNSLLVAYLENKNPNLLSKAKQYIQLIKKVPAETSNLGTIYVRDISILNSIKDNSLFTETHFIVPISIKSLKERIHISLQDNIEADVTCVALPAQNVMHQYEGNASVIRNQDHDATYSVSSWTITIDRYLSCEKPSPIDSSASIMQEYVCKVINKVIDKYRVKTGEYWVKNIYPAMIQGHSIAYRAKNLIFRNILFFDRGGITISSKQSEISLTDNNGSVVDDPPLYIKLFMDAQTHLLTQNLSSSVLLLNIAFENFTYAVVCPMIIKLSQGTYNNEFYLKILPYKDYFLKNYLTKDQYEDAISKKIIKAKGMSQYAIYKLLYENDPALQQKISKIKLTGLISSIRKNRNEIAHGNFNDTMLKHNDVTRQMQSFDKLVSLVENK